MPDYLRGSDGMVARRSQPYAKEKLYYVSRYQQIFATGMKYAWPRRAYIDLLAGPGLCRVEQTGEEFPGSPVLSLDADFTDRVFVEADVDLAAALRLRVPTYCHVLEADATTTSTISQIRALVPANALGLAFIDNLGLDVSFSTLRELTAARKIDLVIVFQTQDFTRNLRDAVSGKDDPDRVTDFFGDVGWFDLARDAFRDGLLDGDVASVMLDFYLERLHRIGYPHTTECRRQVRNARNAPQYRVLLAGRHQKAVEFFDKIQRIEYGGQRSLL